MIKQIKSVVSIPVIAIGGINCDNVEEVIASGADGVAVISVVVGQPDITAATRDLKKRITAAKQKHRC
jgi:thiamine-phosphate pyrophosphorylase